MFEIVRHHNPAILARKLAATISEQRANTCSNALTPIDILVPNSSVGRWLNIQLAQNNHISANLKMHLPSRYLWELLRKMDSSMAEPSPYEPKRLVWYIYALLDKKNRAVESRSTGTTSQNPNGMTHQWFQAMELGRIFHEYLTYRPHMLLEWERKSVDRSADPQQVQWWLDLVELIGNRHHGRLMEECSTRLDCMPDDQIVQFLPSRLICFGLAHLAPPYVQLLGGLSKKIEVLFYLNNPCNEYWGDIKTQRVRLYDLAESVDNLPYEHKIATSHPLLASLGRAQRDLIRMLYSDQLQAQEFDDSWEDLESKEIDSAGEKDPLLKRIQAGIIKMNAHSDETSRPTTNDDQHDQCSLQIHACHTPLREVQVLRDQLLDLMMRDPTLEFKDIAVMMPDINRYASAIRAVFKQPVPQTGNSTAGDQRWDYYITDSSRISAEARPIVEAFQQLLKLPQSRCAANEIIDLLEIPAIARKFDLTPSDAENLRRWIEPAGVRWGLDEHMRHPDSQYRHYSWAFALDRLLLGTAQVNEQELTHGIAPFSDVEGQSAEAVGKLWWLIDRLEYWRGELQKSASAEQWLQRLFELVEAFFLFKENEKQAHTAIREAIKILNDATEVLQIYPDVHELDGQMIAALIEDELQKPFSRQNFYQGGITFCSLISQRVLPFKVIALLGMNDGDFPRHDMNQTNNIIRKQRRIGELSKRDDDRLLFLQALMSASDTLYISYQGFEPRDGKKLPPSVVVGELLEFIEQYHAPDFDKLIHKQPLQPFSSRYGNDSDPRILTFEQGWGIEASHPGLKEKPRLLNGCFPLEQPGDDISLSALKRFFRHPTEYYLQRVLSINLTAREPTLKDVEPWELDKLEKWQFLHHWLQENMNDPRPDCDDAENKIRDYDDAQLWSARGYLPPPPLDQWIYNELTDPAQELLKWWSKAYETLGASTSSDIDLTLNSIRLTGRVENVWAQGLRRIRPGQWSMKHVLPEWVDYLAWTAQGNEGVMELAGRQDPKKPDIFKIDVFEVSDPEVARKLLQRLCVIYHKGMRQPMCFMPGLAEEYLKKLKRQGNISVTDFFATLNKDDWDLNDPSFQLHFPLNDSACKDFGEFAHDICELVIEKRKKIGIDIS